MYTFAQDIGAPKSLIEPLRELQDRIRLEVPEEYVKTEEIRESADQQTAGLTLIWYDRADGKPDGEPMDVEPIVDRLTEEVLMQYPIAWDFSTQDEDNVFTHETQVKARWQEGKEPTTADVPPDDSVDPYSFTTTVGNVTYAVATTHGTEWSVLRNGEVVEDGLGSVPAAFGAMVKHLLADLSLIGEELGNPSAADDGDLDFLTALAPALASSPVVSEEARGHLITFVEMVTGHELDLD